MCEWPVIQKYNMKLVILGSCSSPRPAEAEYLEFRLPNEWGDPDKIVTRTIRWARFPDGSPLQPIGSETFLAKNGMYRIFSVSPSHALSWKIEEID